MTVAHDSVSFLSHALLVKRSRDLYFPSGWYKNSWTRWLYIFNFQEKLEHYWLRLHYYYEVVFFYSSTLLRSVNATKIALVPKVETSTTINDFRPISYCCNVKYKCISKVIVNRLKRIFLEVIGSVQTVFVPGRKIFDSILLTQELMHNYHLASSMTRCALKIDFTKAFNMVSWDFIRTGLRAIGVPGAMVRWIEICMSMTHFFMAMNGESHGFFPSSRGLRQGDLLSLYLFVLAMKGLRDILREALQNPRFRYH
jgi:hypothetical protein